MGGFTSYKLLYAAKYIFWRFLHTLQALHIFMIYWLRPFLKQAFLVIKQNTDLITRHTHELHSRYISLTLREMIHHIYFYIISHWDFPARLWPICSASTAKLPISRPQTAQARPRAQALARSCFIDSHTLLSQSGAASFSGTRCFAYHTIKYRPQPSFTPARDAFPSCRIYCSLISRLSLSSISIYIRYCAYEYYDMRMRADCFRKRYGLVSILAMIALCTTLIAVSDSRCRYIICPADMGTRGSFKLDWCICFSSLNIFSGHTVKCYWLRLWGCQLLL